MNQNNLQVDPALVEHWKIEGRDFLLLDCRETEEYEIVHLDGSRLIPMSEIENRLDELASFQDQSIVVYCHHGVRSLHVARWLSMQGFSAVHSMHGGIDRWAREIDPNLPRY